MSHPKPSWRASLDDRAGLAGRAAIVTGGGGGLGRAAVLGLAAAGVRVAFCDIDADALACTAADVGELGPAVHAVHADVRDGDALAAFFAAAIEELGGVDVLVVVPGGTRHVAFIETGSASWQRMIELNFVHVARSVQLAAPSMIAGAGGSIITVSSTEGHRAAPGMAVYGAMKAAVESLTRTLAVELSGAAVRVNSIAPDMVRTEAAVVRGWFPADESAPAARLTHEIALPMGRMGTEAEFADAVLFLASDLASYVTGQTLFLDGGSRAAAGWWRWPGGGFRVKPPREIVDHLLAGGGGAEP
jgi:NAD(P)-dependent dehydrogenase (short-subunit alcohol dehydrogenase family)